MSKSETVKVGQVPGRYKKFLEKHPDVARAYNALGDAAQAAGPLDAKTRALAKLGIAIGMQHEGAVHSHTRKAIEAGAKPDEVRHVALLAVTTLGFPRMMAARGWIEDVLAL
ncbi:MAG: carboxymuconolactone decarboxylase family protein [Verrucomicrobia bacterium]|nr:carboxymuconolactone decarboxylase family protein [Verrucomicrobiota bacterium]